MCVFRFFAGGSERSGQQIVGPPKKKSSNEVVEDLFKGAREHGAVPLERSGRGPGEPSRARVRGNTRSENQVDGLHLYLLSVLTSFFISHYLGLCRRRLQARSSS